MELLMMVQSLGRSFATVGWTSPATDLQGPVAYLRQALHRNLSWPVRNRQNKNDVPMNEIPPVSDPPAAGKQCEVEIPFRVKTSDIDFAGHVGNMVYIHWLEDLQLQMLHTYFPLETLMQQEGLAPMLLHTHIEYKREITLFDKTVGRMWITDLGTLKLTLHAEIEVEGKIAATAEQSLCFVNIAKRRAVKVPEAVRKVYQEYTTSGN